MEELQLLQGHLCVWLSPAMALPPLLEVLAPARMLRVWGHRSFALWWRGALQAWI